MTRTANSIAEVVTSGLCIGCGLCEAITGGRVTMNMTDYGGLRPTPVDDFSDDEESQLLKSCPGVIAEPRQKLDTRPDLVWGQFSSMRYAWAGDADIRFRSATGGVLTALGVHIVRERLAKFVLHVGADPVKPMRSRWVMSETPEQIIANSGSRYGPTAPLVGLCEALDRGNSFAIVAKPCDLGAIYQYAKLDPRLDELCIVRLTMVCGGQSQLKKSQDVLDEFGLNEDELSVFRYRGYGNPGALRVETKDGRAFEKTYLDLWADEAGWGLETRCKFCPDALGEAADIAATDVWPGGSPVGEDAGFNGIVVRSSQGSSIVASAVESGDLVIRDTITPEELNDMQPHQVRKKISLSARFEGLADASFPILETPGLRLEELGRLQDSNKRKFEKEGTKQRASLGRIEEPLP